MSAVFLFLFAIISDLFLLFLTVYFTITLSDLECDYINARECCRKLNRFVIPELVVKLLPTVLFLLNGYWVLIILNIGFDAWYIYRIVKKPKAYVGYFDPLEIHNRGELKNHVRDSMIKLGEHLVFFFIYLYYVISSLIS